MIYVVTGLHRTGTSLMMRALSCASSLRAEVDPAIEARIRSREVSADYDPNPNGYWHPGDDKLPHHCTDDSLLKVHVRMWPEIELGNYTVVLTTRDASERVSSFEASFGCVEPAGIGDLGEANLRSRPDVALTVLDFALIQADPVAAFSQLAGNGWPIDVNAAAALVDPALHRHKA